MCVAAVSEDGKTEPDELTSLCFETMWTCSKLTEGLSRTALMHARDGHAGSEGRENVIPDNAVMQI